MPPSPLRNSSGPSGAPAKEPLTVPVLLLLAQLYLGLLSATPVCGLLFWDWAMYLDDDDIFRFTVSAFVAAIALALAFRTVALIHKRSPLARSFSIASLVICILLACVAFLGAWLLTGFGGDTSELQAAMAVSVLFFGLDVFLILYFAVSPEVRHIFAPAPSWEDFSAREETPLR